MNECIHHWIIDQAGHGVCKKCGAEKDFPLINDYRLYPDREMVSARRRHEWVHQQFAEVIGRRKVTQ